MAKATGSQRGCPGTRTNCILPRRARTVYTRCNVRHNPVVTLVALAWQVGRSELDGTSGQRPSPSATATTSLEPQGFKAGGAYD